MALLKSDADIDSKGVNRDKCPPIISHPYVTFLAVGWNRNSTKVTSVPHSMLLSVLAVTVIQSHTHVET